jgi:hypothetical protein
MKYCVESEVVHIEFLRKEVQEINSIPIENKNQPKQNGKGKHKARSKSLVEVLFSNRGNPIGSTLK